MGRGTVRTVGRLRHSLTLRPVPHEDNSSPVVSRLSQSQREPKWAPRFHFLELPKVAAEQSPKMTLPEQRGARGSSEEHKGAEGSKWTKCALAGSRAAR